MDIMDIQAVESKLSDVTVTPIPRSQVQNFYNYQQQREQREQQPQIQISAIHHVPRERHGERSSGGAVGVGLGRSGGVGIGDPQNLSKHEREYHQQTTSPAAAVAAVKAMQMSQLQQQLHAQLAASMANAVVGSYAGNNNNNSSNTNNAPSVSMYSSSSGSSNNSNNNSAGLLKYPTQSTSPAIITTQTSANITTPMTSSAGLPSLSVGMGSSMTKYAQLLAIIEDMGRDIRPTYTGSRSSTERLKRGIVTARMLVRECLLETERSARP